MPVSRRLLALLRRLPIAELRKYSTMAHDNPPAPSWHLLLDDGLHVFSRSELIAFYPPDVPPEEALKPPPALPTWRFYIDGRWLYIATQADYDQLPPGHSGRSDGPWPEGVVTQVPWAIGEGPYAPVPGFKPSCSAPEPQGHPDKRVYAMKPCFYYGRAYARRGGVRPQWGQCHGR